MNFKEQVEAMGKFPIKSVGISTLQINLGKLCNLSCRHCHVDAGPDRSEVMSDEIVDACMKALESEGIETIDITGGAPEMHPGLEHMIEKAGELNKKIIVRTNLVTLALDRYRHLGEVYRDNKVTVVASLPCYCEDNVDAQRGRGVYEKSIESLKYLNELGYGREEDLILKLVYNPGGPFLPPPQKKLREDYKNKLREDHGIEFNDLFTITNLPIGRFRKELESADGLSEYEQLLKDSFNASTLDGLMCRSQISVSWDGFIYDCDFNQMLDLKSDSDVKSIMEFDIDELSGREIVLGDHCYGCTAGSGSSCGGSLV